MDLRSFTKGFKQTYLTFAYSGNIIFIMLGFVAEEVTDSFSCLFAAARAQGISWARNYSV
jgi:hypothetical protein